MIDSDFAVTNQCGMRYNIGNLQLKDCRGLASIVLPDIFEDATGTVTYLGNVRRIGQSLYDQFLCGKLTDSHRRFFGSTSRKSRVSKAPVFLFLRSRCDQCPAKAG